MVGLDRLLKDAVAPLDVKATIVFVVWILPTSVLTALHEPENAVISVVLATLTVAYLLFESIRLSHPLLGMYVGGFAVGLAVVPLAFAASTHEGVPIEPSYVLAFIVSGVLSGAVVSAIAWRVRGSRHPVRTGGSGGPVVYLTWAVGAAVLYAVSCWIVPAG